MDDVPITAANAERMDSIAQESIAEGDRALAQMVAAMKEKHGNYEQWEVSEDARKYVEKVNMDVLCANIYVAAKVFNSEAAEFLRAVASMVPDSHTVFLGGIVPLFIGGCKANAVRLLCHRVRNTTGAPSLVGYVRRFLAVYVRLLFKAKLITQELFDSCINHLKANKPHHKQTTPGIERELAVFASLIISPASILEKYSVQDIYNDLVGSDLINPDINFSSDHSFEDCLRNAKVSKKLASAFGTYSRAETSVVLDSDWPENVKDLIVAAAPSEDAAIIDENRSKIVEIHRQLADAEGLRDKVEDFHREQDKKADQYDDDARGSDGIASGISTTSGSESDSEEDPLNQSIPLEDLNKTLSDARDQQLAAQIDEPEVQPKDNEPLNVTDIPMYEPAAEEIGTKRKNLEEPKRVKHKKVKIQDQGRKLLDKLMKKPRTKKSSGQVPPKAAKRGKKGATFDASDSDASMSSYAGNVASDGEPTSPVKKPALGFADYMKEQERKEAEFQKRIAGLAQQNVERANVVAATGNPMKYANNRAIKALKDSMRSKSDVQDMLSDIVSGVAGMQNSVSSGKEFIIVSSNDKCDAPFSGFYAPDAIIDVDATGATYTQAKMNLRMNGGVAIAPYTNMYATEVARLNAVSDKNPALIQANKIIVAIAVGALVLGGKGVPDMLSANPIDVTRAWTSASREYDAVLKLNNFAYKELMGKDNDKFQNVRDFQVALLNSGLISGFVALGVGNYQTSGGYSAARARVQPSVISLANSVLDLVSSKLYAFVVSPETQTRTGINPGWFSAITRVIIERMMICADRASMLRMVYIEELRARITVPAYMEILLNSPPEGCARFVNACQVIREFRGPLPTLFNEDYRELENAVDLVSSSVGLGRFAYSKMALEITGVAVRNQTFGVDLSIANAQGLALASQNPDNRDRFPILVSGLLDSPALRNGATTAAVIRAVTALRNHAAVSGRGLATFVDGQVGQRIATGFYARQMADILGVRIDPNDPIYEARNP